MIAYLGTAGWWDLAYHRIPNLLNLAAILMALALSASRGTPYLVLSLKGIAMGTGIGLVPFALRMLGGGDIKSLMALGAFAGPALTWSCFIGALMAGGVFGVLLLLPSLPILGRGRIRKLAGLPLPFTTLLALVCFLQLIIFKEVGRC
jgi:prepilin peptidase CpaA